MRADQNPFDRNAPTSTLPITNIEEPTLISSVQGQVRSREPENKKDPAVDSKASSWFANLFSSAAKPVKTADVVEKTNSLAISTERKKVYDFLQRTDVRELMVRLNFKQDELFKALDELSDEEVKGFAERVDRLLASVPPKKDPSSELSAEKAPDTAANKTVTNSLTRLERSNEAEAPAVVLASVSEAKKPEKDSTSISSGAKLPVSVETSTPADAAPRIKAESSEASKLPQSDRKIDSVETKAAQDISVAEKGQNQPAMVIVAAKAEQSPATEPRSTSAQIDVSPKPENSVALATQEPTISPAPAADRAKIERQYGISAPARKPIAEPVPVSKTQSSPRSAAPEKREQLAQAGGGLFGAPTAPTSGGLFGSQPAAPQGGGLFSSPTPAAPQNTGTLTLNESLRNAIETNPKIRIALAQTTAVQSNRLGVFSGFLPQVDANTAAGYQSIENNSTRQDGRGNYETSRRRENSLTLTQPIFSGFETIRSLDKMDAKIDVTKWRALQLTNELAMDVVTAHTDVLKYDEVTNVIQEQKKFHQKILDSVQRRATGGAGSSSDVAVVSARIARLETTLARNIEDSLSAASVYERLVGERPRDLKRPDRVNDNALPKTVDEALDRAVKGSPALRSEDSEIAAATADVDVPRSRYLPRIGLELEGSRDSFADAERGDKDSFKAMVRMRWNIYRGGADRAAELEALSRVQEARGRKDLSLIELKEQVRKIFSRLEQAKTRVSALKESVSFSKRARENIAQQFEVGQKSLIEVLDAANEEFVSEIDLVSNEYGLIVIQHQLLWIVGDILSQMDATAEDGTKNKIQENLDKLELKGKGRS